MSVPEQHGAPPVATSLRRPGAAAVSRLTQTVDRHAVAIVRVAVVVWGAGAFLAAACRHQTFWSHRYDLGNMVQAVWTTAHGHPLEVTAGDGEQFTRLGAHFDPLLVAFAPLWWVWPSPLLLLAIQAVGLALGAVPVFWLARKHLGDRVAAVALALAYLAYPATVYSALNDFHAVKLAIPLLLVAVWYLDETRWIPFAACAGAAMLTKEEVGLAVAGLGVWYLISRRDALRAAAIVVAGLAVTAIALFAVVPHFGFGENPFFGRYAEVGGDPLGVLKTAVTDPGRLADAATQRRDATYLIGLFAPVLGLAFLAPAMLIPTLPAFALNLISGFWSQNSIRYQYVSTIVPFVLAATVLGVARLRENRRVAAVVVLIASVNALVIFGPLRQVARYAREQIDPGPRVTAIRAALERLPAGVPVSTTNLIGAHVSERRFVYSFPVVERARYVVIEEGDPWLPVAGERDDPKQFAEALRRFRAADGWRLVYRRDGIDVYRRVEGSG